MKPFSTTICGHRGGGGDPESLKALVPAQDIVRGLDHYALRELWANRLPTFEYMIKKGISCFELDLLPSKDSDVIVVHNSIIDGRNAWEWSRQELQQKGCCTLEELLNAIEKTKQKITLLLEVKGSLSSETSTDIGSHGISEPSKILIQKVVDIITERTAKHGWGYDQLPVIGFNHQMLEMVKQLNPKILIGLSYAVENLSPNMIEDAKKSGAYAINPDDRFVNKELVESAHEAGLKVQSWTSYRIEPRPKEMIELGVDTLITDCPLEALRLLSSASA